MSGTIRQIQSLFLARLNTLSEILTISIEHATSEAEAIMSYRLVDDMAPFGTQISFMCDQPYNFARWCDGLPMENHDPGIASLADARKVIADTRHSVENISADDTKLLEIKRIQVGEGQYLELPGMEYVDEFLLPNCYFHLVTAYNIMRMRGVPLGKANFMSHLVPKIQHG